VNEKRVKKRVETQPEKSETYRQLQMRLLKFALCAQSMERAPVKTYEEAVCAKALWQSGHAFGDCKEPIDSAPFVLFNGISTSGFQLLQDLEQQERESTLCFRWKQRMWDASAFILGGVITAILSAAASWIGK